LAEYVSGDAEKAVAELASWDRAEVERATASIEHAEATAGPWRRGAWALLHTEAGLQRGDLGDVIVPRSITSALDLVLPVDHIEIHLRRSITLTEGLLTEASLDPRLATLLRDWHLLVATHGGGDGSMTTFGSVTVLAPRRFPKDAASWLVFASRMEPNVVHRPAGQGFAFIEYLDGARMRSLYRGVHDTRPVSLRMNRHRDEIDPLQWQETEYALREALKLDPMLVEARLRRGRLLDLVDRVDEAKTEWRRALEESTGSAAGVIGYLAALWLGRSAEETREVDAAEGYYQRAATLRPDARSARVALAALRSRQGRASDAYEAAAATVGLAGHDRDPVILYRYGQTWQRPDILRRARALVREAS
jgi:hypothetical protein